jgi:cell wall-associated NlpC family hydrolase
MPSPSIGTRLRALLGATAVAAATFTALGAPAAHASTAIVQSPSASSTTSTTLTPRERFALKAHKVLKAAASRKGDPYVYGAAGPHRFDCSGLVLWAFGRALGKSLPHSAEMQMQRSKPIYHRANLRPGDLIFEVDSGGYAYHVGIFAGHNHWWVAPHSGSQVQLQHLYPSRKRFGRLIRA